MAGDGHHTAKVIAAQAHPERPRPVSMTRVIRQGEPQTEHGPTWRRPVRAITSCQYGLADAGSSRPGLTPWPVSSGPGKGSRGPPSSRILEDTHRLAGPRKTRRVSGCLHTDITTDETGRPALSWHFDRDVLQAEAAVDGWYALLTTLTPEQADPSEVLRRHKGQGAVERRYGDFKGPLAVTPVFVQDNRHVAALIAVI